MASQYGKGKIVKILLEKGANIEVQSKVVVLNFLEIERIFFFLFFFPFELFFD